ncbi:hypothetical protein J3A83DRAFT_4376630 [Scleroderma citrinum]
MGVKSLWSLLEPVGRPVPLENLEGKALAIDSSIWMYQFQATMRDKDGRALMNAHVLGFLRRICKLLFYGIRPVFVFDGGAPALKRNTITERKKKKSGAAASHAQIAERLLAAQMRRDALVQVHASRPPPSKGKQKVPSGSIILDKDAVYLEDIDSSLVKTPAKSKDAQPSPAASTKKSRFHDHDPYKLPEVNLEEQVAKATRTHVPDVRLATEEELMAFIEEMHPDDFDVTSPAFRELPTEVQYEIVGDLRLKSRQTSYTRLQNMLRKAETPLDFSKEQIKNLQQRNALTQQLLITTDSIGKAHINIPVRIASERNKEYVLIKNENAEGGWVLGLRNEGSQSQPIEVDADDREESDDDMDMEEVSIPEPVRSRQPSVAANKPSSQTTQLSRTVKRHRARRLFDPDEDDDYPRLPSEDISNEDPELAIAIQASLDTHHHPDVSLVEPSSGGALFGTPPSKIAPLASAESSNVWNVLSASDDWVEDLYESPSRLETALAIAGAGPLRKPSGTFLERGSSSTFGKPSLLVSPKSSTRPLVPTPPNLTPQDHYVTAQEAQLIDIGETVLPKAYPPSIEKLPNTAPVPSPRLTYSKITLDTENSNSDDDMEEIAVGEPSINGGSIPPTETTARQGPEESEEPVSTQSSPLSPEVASVAAESDNGSEIEWSRSPSPTGNWTKDADMLPTLHPLVENSETWDAAQEMDPHAEEGEFARFVSQVKGKDLEDVRHEIDEEIRVLNQQKKNAMRDSEDITQHMISQIMLLLRLFGIPYITAPMEAEAQCAELVRLGLVEGIITDDSDVFLFGGLRVYKNMFNQAKTVECFLLADLAREVGLTRDALIRLAYLLGSDYVEGLPGVGPVMAMELMKEFPGEDGLHKFKDWWSKVQSGRDRGEDNKTKFRTRFKKIFKDLYLHQEWPNPLVRDAYYHPAVDSSEEPFKWGMPDLDALRHFVHDELGWDQSKVDALMMPIIQKMSRRSQAASLNRQGDLNGFFHMVSGTGSYAPRKRQTYNSKRLQQVVTEFRKEQGKMCGRSATTSSDDQESNLASETEIVPLKKKRRKTTMSRKGKDTGPTETVPTTKKKRRRGPRVATTGPRNSKRSHGDEDSDDGSDSEDEFAGAEGAQPAMIPSAPLAVSLRPRVRPRIRQARKQGDLSPSDPADKVS